MNLAFNKFLGEVPKMPEYDVPFNMATSTMDVDLRDGSIRAWRDTTVVFRVEDGNSMFPHGCNYLVWDGCVSAAASTINANKILLVGRRDYAEQLRIEGNVKNYTRLGLPSPTAAPSVSSNLTEHKEHSYPTRYVTTFVNIYGQEGPPSPASKEVLIDDEQGVSVIVGDLPSSPGSEYKVAAINIYRLTQPYREGNDDAPLQTDGVWLLAATVKIGVRDHIDRKKMVNLSHPLMTQEFREPPLGLQQIQAIPGTNTFVGFRGHMVYFSENNRYWNWPSTFDMTLDRTIKHIQVLDGVLLVTTTGAPYIISDLDKCEKRVCRPVVEFPIGNVGDISCDQLSGSVVTPFGMVYPTVDGLALFGSKGDFGLLTKDYFSTKQWEQLRPDTAKLAYWSGLLFCITEKIGFLLRMDDKSFATDEIPGITQISDSVRAIATNTDGQLLMLKEDGVHHWNSSNDFRVFVWENSQIGADAMQTFSAYRADGMAAKVEIKANASDKLVTCDQLDNKPHRVPRIGRHRNYTFRVTGEGFLTYFLLGSSITEITRMEG